jgi:cell division protein FtsB
MPQKTQKNQKGQQRTQQNKSPRKSSTRVASKPLTAKEFIIASILCLVLLWLIFLNISIAKKEEIARKAAYAARDQLTALQTRQSVLQGNINELSTERGQEETVRNTFGVAKPGEGEIIVLPPKEATTTPPQTFWQKYFGWLQSL